MELTDIDLNQLVLFQQLMIERRVSKVAENLGLTQPAVSNALAQLPTEQRLALTLVAIEGKTYSEAAEILEVPVGTIMSRIARARKQLVEIYSPSITEQEI